MAYHADVIATLDTISHTVTPREAVNYYTSIMADQYEHRASHSVAFFFEALPEYMRQAGVTPNVEIFLKAEPMELLVRVIKGCCMEDIEHIRREANIEIQDITDDDILGEVFKQGGTYLVDNVYDGAGGYAHNSDDGSDFEVTIEEQNDVNYGFEATQGNAPKYRKSHRNAPPQDVIDSSKHPLLAAHMDYDKRYAVEHYSEVLGGWMVIRGGMTLRGARRMYTNRTSNNRKSVDSINKYHADNPAKYTEYRVSEFDYTTWEYTPIE